ncbi:ADP-ribosylglycohydrolase family protein [Sinosporangium siamense]|uniref:ADP-ribosylglycohydrolase n=1 Tax=Sinosporangium siamense TaxID=1367973 RepID=A0A919RG40_9ACTN|nr:ADP-ribosylglycohydrolase family protein [Sinosporangium siamense]GII92757.1 ADP-ribosylglycohydrolase [Sinosporangium siamense]
MRTDRQPYAAGALLGLALGDAVGLPAQFHRRARSGWARATGWRLTADLDEQRVSRPLLPFTLGAGDDIPLSPTDDAETAAVAALILLRSPDHSPGALFARWREHMIDAPDVWTGIAERSATLNAAHGLEPPATGTDNPAHYTDSAVPAAVSIGIHYAGAPARAAEVAGHYAQITHAEDGIWAAQAMADAIARLVAGTPLPEALAAATATVPSGSWLARNLARAAHIRTTATSPFEAVPALITTLSPATYSHGGIAPETLPVAFALTHLAQGDLPTAVMAAALISRQSDSMPAMVGALCGATHGLETIPETWRSHLNPLAGVLTPHLKGIHLTDLAHRLTA